MIKRKNTWWYPVLLFSFVGSFYHVDFYHIYISFIVIVQYQINIVNSIGTIWLSFNRMVLGIPNFWMKIPNFSHENRSSYSSHFISFFTILLLHLATLLVTSATTNYKCHPPFISNISYRSSFLYNVRPTTVLTKWDPLQLSNDICLFAAW